MKVNRLTGLLACLLAWLSARGGVDMDTTLIAMVDHTANDVQLHVRSIARNWQLVWDKRDDNNYKRIDVTHRPSDNHDFTRALTTIRHVSLTDGKPTELARLRFDNASSAVSVMITRRRDDIDIVVGNDRHLDCSKLSAVTLADTCLYELIHPATATPDVCYIAVIPDHSRCVEYYTAAQVDTMMSRAADSLCGLWRYLDCDIDDRTVQLAKRYSLIILNEPQGGGYLILDADPEIVEEQNAATGRTPDICPPTTDTSSHFRLKGRLTPTIFDGNYNLTWYDSRNNETGHATEAYATHSGAILTLAFPTIDSSFRLSRVP